MKRKLPDILLVDDDDDCNFFHKRVLNQSDCVENIDIAKDGKAALDLLDLKWKEKKNFPSIIFLDIKMPRMDGWEFLNEYQKMNKIWQAKSVVIIFTIAFNPDNLAKAMSYQFVKGFKSKYLDKEGLDQILIEHFNDYL
jgi:CheY-like chemotaxis protein